MDEKEIGVQDEWAGWAAYGNGGGDLRAILPSAELERTGRGEEGGMRCQSWRQTRAAGETVIARGGRRDSE